MARRGLPIQSSISSHALIDEAIGAVMYEVIKVSPFRCRVWELNGRMEEYLTDASCSEEIESIRAYGQIVPAIGRRISGDSVHKIEILCGARRLFATRQLNIDLAVEIRDLSAYERGRSYARWLASGLFESQDVLARSLKVSASQVSRLLKVAKLPNVIVDAFPDPTAICETWALELHAKCEDANTRSRVLACARALRSRETRPRPREVFAQLMLERSAKAVRQRQTNEVVPGREGKPAFRIKYQDTTISVLIDKKNLSDASLLRIKQAILEILQDASAQVSVNIKNPAATRHNGSVANRTIA